MTETLSSRVGKVIGSLIVAGIVALVGTLIKISVDVSSLTVGQQYTADTVRNMGAKLDKVPEMSADMRGMRVELDDHDRRLNALEQQRQLQRWTR